MCPFSDFRLEGSRICPQITQNYYISLILMRFSSQHQYCVIQTAFFRHWSSRSIYHFFSSYQKCSFFNDFDCSMIFGLCRFQNSHRQALSFPRAQEQSLNSALMWMSNLRCLGPSARQMTLKASLNFPRA